jgi:hypothetical protein
MHSAVDYTGTNKWYYEYSSTRYNTGLDYKNTIVLHTVHCTGTVSRCDPSTRKFDFNWNSSTSTTYYIQYYTHSIILCPRALSDSNRNATSLWNCPTVIAWLMCGVHHHRYSRSSKSSRFAGPLRLQIDRNWNSFQCSYKVCEVQCQSVQE